MTTDDEGDARAVPAKLATVVEFVNTRRIESDELGTSQGLENWLRSRGLLPEGTTVGAGGRERAVQVREGLRAMFALNNRAPADRAGAAGARPDGPDPAALPALVTLSRDLPLVLDVLAAPPRLVPRDEGTTDGALASLLALVAEAVASGTWARLKACRECWWAYYDQSRNRSRAWCSMTRCGNRVKARTFRSRSRA